jgi:CheY-like chemotaxis protein
MSILSVDDEPEICVLVSRILRRHGYDVLNATGPDEAMRVAQSHGALSLLISDVRMPGMNGPELTERLRSQMPSLKVLFISGHPEGAPSPLLAKPFTAGQLVSTVREIMTQG